MEIKVNQQELLVSLQEEIKQMNTRTLETFDEEYGLLFTRGGGSRPKGPAPL